MLSAWCAVQETHPALTGTFKSYKPHLPSRTEKPPLALDRTSLGTEVRMSWRSQSPWTGCAGLKYLQWRCRVVACPLHAHHLQSAWAALLHQTWHDAWQDWSMKLDKTSPPILSFSSALAVASRQLAPPLRVSTTPLGGSKMDPEPNVK